ncbi:hypothetical protein BCR44DRAFT_94975 [Catenaria anguillulae PL171]|uniref:N-acetylgalactosaminide beta-1,3-galactosyltransferase n=1 Tax=Catenaria anguillulae PL171 TaxID=765915 RepID=A0A1Y2HXD4_9FUNG|nr:hypothetical protein BCR44DRAFT_94975 [Catenaria anguillulae PL171]
MAPHIRTKPTPFASRGARHGPMFSSRATARLAALLLVLVFVIGLLRSGDGGSQKPAEPQPEGAVSERRYPPPAVPRKLSEATEQPRVAAPVVTAVDPDPRWDRFAVAVRSFSESANSRIAFMHSAWLSGIKNVIVVGNKNMERIGNTNMTMVDLASDVAKVAMRVQEGDLAIEDESTNDDDLTSELDEALGDDPLSRYLREAEQIAREAQRKHKNGHKSANGKDEKQESAYYRLRKRSTIPAESSRDSLLNQETTDHPMPRPDHEFHLATVRTLHKRFPRADWYLLVEDNTHVFMENLHHALFSMDPSKPLYLGLPTMATGACQGLRKATVSLLRDLRYPSSASGIIISRGAVEQLVPIVDRCIIKYQGCTTGDQRLGVCMREANVTMTSDTTLSNDRFQTRGAELTSMSFSDDACVRPISISNMAPKSFALMSTLATTARISKQQFSTHQSGHDPWSNVSTSTHPWLYTPGTEKLVAQTSPHYAPITMGDLLKGVIAAGEDKATLAPILKDSARPGGTEYDLDRSIVSLDTCRTRCVKDRACRSWEFDIKGLTCRRFKGIPAPEERPLAFSGMLHNRYTCNTQLL